jgi:hypothetical protein
MYQEEEDDACFNDLPPTGYIFIYRGGYGGSHQNMAAGSRMVHRYFWLSITHEK